MAGTYSTGEGMTEECPMIFRPRSQLFLLAIIREFRHTYRLTDTYHVPARVCLVDEQEKSMASLEADEYIGYMQSELAMKQTMAPALTC